MSFADTRHAMQHCRSRFAKGTSINDVRFQGRQGGLKTPKILESYIQGTNRVTWYVVGYVGLGRSKIAEKSRTSYMYGRSPTKKFVRTACSTHVPCSNIVRRFLKGLPFFVVFVCAKNIKFRNSCILKLVEVVLILSMFFFFIELVKSSFS